MTIGERIRSRRKSLNLTMQAIYEKENIKTGNLSELEHDKYLPSVQTLIALGRILQCSIDWILTGEEYQDREINSLKFRTLKSEQGLLCDGSPLEEEEADLIAMYRLLPDLKKEDAFDIIYTLYQKHVEQKKDSIYWTYKEDRDGKSDPAKEHEAQGGTA